MPGWSVSNLKITTMKTIENEMNALMGQLKEMDVKVRNLIHEANDLDKKTVEILTVACRRWFSFYLDPKDTMDVQLNSVTIRRKVDDGYIHEVACFRFDEEWGGRGQYHFRDVSFSRSSINSNKVEEIKMLVTAGMLAGIFVVQKDSILQGWNEIHAIHAETKSNLNSQRYAIEREMDKIRREYERQKGLNRFYDAKDTGLKLDKVDWNYTTVKMWQRITSLKLKTTATGKNCTVTVTCQGYAYDGVERIYTATDTIATDKVMTFLSRLQDKVILPQDAGN